jgi:hypothetical protein
MYFLIMYSIYDIIFINALWVENTAAAAWMFEQVNRDSYYIRARVAAMQYMR